MSLALVTGGLERMLVDFARFADPERCRPTFVALHEEGRPAADIRTAGYDVVTLGAQRDGRIRLLRRLVELFRELQPDVVHTHNSFPHVYATLAARWAGVPVVVHTRHGQRFGLTWWTRQQFCWVSRLVDCVVAVSDDAAGIARSYGVPAAKVARIWNGIDLSRFHYRGPANVPTAISVARLSAEKDFPCLLKAAQLTAREVPDFRLLIAGEGPERPLLEALIERLSLGGCVRLLGEQNRVPDLLADAGFFVSSSRTEGLSLALLEAMAVGLPALTTRVGGNAEVVVDGETGRLVPPEDPEALAAAMVDLCERAAYWPSMGLAGRQRVERWFSAPTMLDQYHELYDRLFEGAAVKSGRAAR